ncbi:hypothetical protein L3081_24625 [Colwellia sp. MSW7]|jgi:hypothetical protein|uniref:Uncharacterized protein n=1 Tax=Colwellia maritima TaxID=2912588 RepID=A0ABS9X711_9GAMM|nr:hypothetical protein [Colwellia maritima]MCI2286012.1 hypothetical protein [Colwellia maritima]
MSKESEIKRGKIYAILTVVAEYDKYEWQERYLCLLDELGDTELTLKALSFAHPEFAKSGVIIDTSYGKRLKIENAIVWFAYKRLRFGEAKFLLDMKILPYVTLN